MIDIHAHILPAFDDGPETLDHSMEMLEHAQNDGIQSIIATPHTLNGVYTCTPDMITHGINTLRDEMDKNKYPYLFIRVWKFIFVMIFILG
ncbi:MAG: Phosphotyrosine-protein phosphatase [Candidatus Magnetoglobus multicellularis str. Araruama]|uniref:protein-tyrosine-phosphatase n=1 Tax=Candidatus Magnetoglobus multicellularis str. Araruama TaxID=890399 RepID=A0A1V1PDQ1_9BACT|nr:MAG: Phosphotyrosine-protein phosphatase [Candidatus Magnetoglobus multicellularis str. Araruama]